MSLKPKVEVLADYQWEAVESVLRQRLLDTFSFERRELGQDVMLSEVISVMQSVRGVAYIDVNAFGGIPEKIADEDGERYLLPPDEIAKTVQAFVGTDEKHPPSLLKVNLAALENGITRPAQIAFLTPDVRATLILNSVKRLP